MILIHNLMAFITAILAFGYFCVNLPKLKDKTVRGNFGLCIVFIFCISAFYWLPLLQTSMSTKYAVYQDNMMATKESISKSALDLKDLFVTQNNSIYVNEIGLHVLIMLCFSVAAFRRIDKKYKKEYIFFLIIGIFSLYMSTKYFPWKLFGKSLSMLQFPWRMLTISNFCLAVVCSINMGIVIKKFKFRDVIIISIISLSYICALNSFIPIEENFKKVEDWNIGLITGKENEVSAGMGKGEYLPELAYNNRFYIASREDSVIILEGNGLIENIKKDGNKLTGKIEAVDNNTIFEFPYIYYPGYVVTIDGSRVYNFEDKNGFLAIELNTMPKSDIIVEYKGTSLMKYSQVFSTISIVFFVLVIFINKDDIVQSEEVRQNA